MVARSLSKKRINPALARILLRPLTLKGQRLAAPRPMTMNSSLFESPKPYVFADNLKNRIPALLWYVIFAQTKPISIILIL